MHNCHRSARIDGRAPIGHYGRNGCGRWQDVTEARLRRYERWTNAAALFVALQVTGFEMNHGIFGGVVYYVSLLTPFGVAIVVDRWFRARAREHRWLDWRAFAWLRSALMLREEWWNSRRQIARAWLLIGLVLGGIALVVGAVLLQRERNTGAIG